MDKPEHCLTCGNQINDLATGIRCALTNQKPNFGNKCEKISFGEQLALRIEEVNLEYELVRRTMGATVFHFIFYFGAALAFILAGFFLGKYIFDSGVISTVPLVIMGMGVMVLPTALGPVNKYRISVQVATKDLSNLGQVLKIYGIEYEASISISKGFHDILDIKSSIVVLKNGKEMGQYENKFSQSI